MRIAYISLMSDCREEVAKPIARQKLLKSAKNSIYFCIKDMSLIMRNLNAVSNYKKYFKAQYT